MSLLAMKILLFLFLFTAFVCLFYYLRKSRVLVKALQNAYEGLSNTSVKRARERKKELLQVVQPRKSFLDKLERQLVYSGLSKKFPFLTAELWILILLASGAVIYFICLTFTKSVGTGLLAAACDILVLLLTEKVLAMRNLKMVDRELIEFLNMLGNYSIASGEVTGILHIVSRYFHNPLRSALEECYYEAQTSGKPSAALLALADKIEHPKFKEIIKNIEISSRYSADFSVVVKDSRKIIQDYIRNKEECKSMAQEAATNMVILCVLLAVAIYAVTRLIDTSMTYLLLHTGIGRICLVIVAAIIIAFVIEVMSIDKED